MLFYPCLHSNPKPSRSALAQKQPECNESAYILGI